MPNLYALELKTALASNTGGPYTATWDRAVVPFTGTIRAVRSVAASIASNARQNTVDIYYQLDAPAAGSNTATTVLVSPMTLTNDNAQAEGSISQAGARVLAGDTLQLRTSAGNSGSQPAFKALVASVLIEKEG